MDLEVNMRLPWIWHPCQFYRIQAKKPEHQTYAAIDDGDVLFGWNSIGTVELRGNICCPESNARASPSNPKPMNTASLHLSNIMPY